jgi:hypothetical protein
MGIASIPPRRDLITPIVEEADMHKHILVLGTLATLALTAAVVSGVNTHRQALSATEPATISIDKLHRSVNASALPLTHIEEPF